MWGCKCGGHRSPKQSNAPTVPSALPEHSPAPSQTEADTEDAGVAPIDPRVLNAIRSEISSIRFETADDSDVKLDIEDLRNSNKLMQESIEWVKESLNAEFCQFADTMKTAIADLTSKINGGKEHSHYNAFELDALAAKGKLGNEVWDSLNRAMEDQDTNNPTQEGLSRDIHVITIVDGETCPPVLLILNQVRSKTVVEDLRWGRVNYNLVFTIKDQVGVLDETLKKTLPIPLSMKKGSSSTSGNDVQSS